MKTLQKTISNLSGFVKFKKKKKKKKKENSMQSHYYPSVASEKAIICYGGQPKS